MTIRMTTALIGATTLLACACSTPQSTVRDRPSPATRATTTAGPGSYYVTAAKVPVHLAPDEAAPVTNVLYRQQRVDVFEMLGSWARVSKYYDGRVEGTTGTVARWVPRATLATTRPVRPVQPGQSRSVPRQAPIPDGVTYTVIDSQIVPGIKRRLDVRLNRKISEDVLRSIALELNARDRRPYQRTFIAYLLPGMKLGAGAWATTHFNPDLEVRILGLTAEEEQGLVNETLEPSREVLGRWLDDRPFVGNRIIIYSQGGKLYLEQKFGDSSSLIKETVEKPSSRGRRFEEIGGDNFGEYFLMGRDGNLEIWDQDGHITTARRIG